MNQEEMNQEEPNKEESNKEIEAEDAYEQKIKSVVNIIHLLNIIFLRVLYSGIIMLFWDVTLVKLFNLPVISFFDALLFILALDCIIWGRLELVK